MYRDVGIEVEDHAIRLLDRIFPTTSDVNLEDAKLHERNQPTGVVHHRALLRRPVFLAVNAVGDSVSASHFRTPLVP